MEDVKVPSWEQIGGRLSRGANKEHREALCTFYGVHRPLLKVVCFSVPYATLDCLLYAP